MVQNLFKNRLGNNGTLLGAGVISCSPSIVEAYGRIGLDFVWMDLEHSGTSPTDSTKLEVLARAAEITGTELVVRITSSEPAIVRKVLDASVRNIVVPRVETASEVEKVVEASQFVHDGQPGERGVGIGRANYWGETISTDYRQQEDDSVMIGVNIENKHAIQNLEDILSVQGLGFVLLGHNDLSVSMGVMPDHDSVEEAIRTFRRMASMSNIPYGRSVGSNSDAISDAVDKEYNFLLIGNEFSAAWEVFGDRVNKYGTR